MATEWNPTWANIFVPLDRGSQLDQLSPSLRSDTSFMPHCLQISNVFGEMSTYIPGRWDSICISPSTWMVTDPLHLFLGLTVLCETPKAFDIHHIRIHHIRIYVYMYIIYVYMYHTYISHTSYMPTNDLKHYSNIVY